MAGPYRAQHTRADTSAPLEVDRHRRDLQGLRGLAVLLVLLGHAGVPLLPGGFIGVDVFFVLSGYLITQLLLRTYQSGNHIGLGSFYARRARRILPTATVVLLATTIVGVALLGVDASRDLIVSAAWTAVFLGNVHLIAEGADYFGAALASPFQQYWSLAVEEQFYLLWPLLLLVGLSLGRRWWTPRMGGLLAALTVTVASFAFSLRTTTTNPVEAYFSTGTRAWELTAGAALALAAARIPELTRRASRTLTGAGLAAIAVAAVVLGDKVPYPGWAGLLPVLGTLAIIAGGLHADQAWTGLTTRPLVHLGNISYATYLWHWPLLILPLYVTGEPPGLANALALLALSAALGWATTTLIENPIRYGTLLAHNGTTAGMSLLAIAGPIVLMSPLLSVPPPNTIGLTAGSSQDVTRHVTVETVSSNAAPITDQTRPTLNQLSRDTGVHVDNQCMTSPRSREVLTCTFGDPNGTRHIILFGDSHAGMWSPALDIWGHGAHVKVTLIAKTSCSPWNLTMWQKRLDEPHLTCAPWREAALAYITQTQPDLVIVGGNVHNIVLNDNGVAVAGESDVNRLWRAGVTDTLTQLRNAGIPVAVLQDVPAYSQEVLTCLAVHRNDTRPCAQQHEPDTYLRRLSIEKEVISATGSELIATYDWFCQKGTCPVIINDIVAYRDNGGHITATYASWLSTVMGERVAELLPEPPTTTPRA